MTQMIHRSAFFIAALFLQSLSTNAWSYDYQKKLIHSNTVHIVKLNADEYEAELIKANQGIAATGREKVSSMARKTGADLAINAGFFDMGDNRREGAPTGSLVIKGKIYNLRKKLQSLVIIDHGLISITQSKPTNYKQNHTSLVSGIPMLINHGIIQKNLADKKGDFYVHPHARTALGLDAHGNLIIVVAEHHYTKDLLSLTIGDVQTLIQSKGKIFAQKYRKGDLSNIKLHELKQILREEFSPKNTSMQGFTIVELANFMHQLGCHYAINLDGGGSSTLWMHGKLINSIFGDKDESLGDKLERPVSDAIIFKLKNQIKKTNS